MFNNDDEDFVVVLRADCGEEIEVWDESVTRVSVFCEKCGVVHPFYAL